MRRRGMCVNCRKSLHGKVIAVNTIEWKHILTGDCDKPEPYPDPTANIPCLCETLHNHCLAIGCKCERHSYEIGTPY